MCGNSSSAIDIDEVSLAAAPMADNDLSTRADDANDAAVGSSLQILKREKYNVLYPSQLLNNIFGKLNNSRFVTMMMMMMMMMMMVMMMVMVVVKWW